MKINNINSTINFGKIIKIEKNDYEAYRPNNDKSVGEKAVINVLNDKTNKFYTTEEAEQIKAFFAPLLDGDDENIIYRKYGDDKYLFTGKEANDILALEKFGKDMQKIKIPQTNFYFCCSEYSDDELSHKLANFKEDAQMHAYQKAKRLASSYFFKNPNYISLKMQENTLEENNSRKICDFEATQTFANGTEKTTTLNLSI